jgi:hypothetical protein
VVKIMLASVQCGSDAAPRTGLPRETGFGRRAFRAEVALAGIAAASLHICRLTTRKMGANSMMCSP